MSGKQKKVTYKELMERNDFLLSRLLEVERAVNYTHSLIVSYIDCNSDSEKLVKFLKEQGDKNGQAKPGDSKGDRKNQSGDTNIKPESGEAGKKLKIRTSETQT